MKKENQRYLLTVLSNKEDAAVKLEAEVKESGAEVEKTESFGNRKLTYPLKKHTEANLVSVFFNGNQDHGSKIEGAVKHDNSVIRYLFSTWNAEIPTQNRSRNRKNINENKEEVAEDVQS